MLGGGNSEERLGPHNVHVRVDFSHEKRTAGIA